jgi:hypothetical protein
MPTDYGDGNSSAETNSRNADNAIPVPLSQNKSPGFSLTDFKAQSRTFPKITLGLKGKPLLMTGPSKCDFMSLYLQICHTIH